MIGFAVIIAAVIAGLLKFLGGHSSDVIWVVIVGLLLAGIGLAHPWSWTWPRRTA